MIVGKETEVWVNRFGDFVLVTWNPCLCCPKTILKEWGRRFKEAGTQFWKGKKSGHDRRMRKFGLRKAGYL